MKRILLIWVYALSFCATASAQNQQPYGTWRLVSAVTTVLSTGEKYEPLGKAPLGYITYGLEGRMQVMVVSDGRGKPGRAAIAYMTDRERKDLLLSWNLVWSGTDQIRDVRLDGERLILTSRQAPGANDGRMGTTSVVFEKVK